MAHSTRTQAYSNRHGYQPRIEEGKYIPRNTIRKPYRVTPVPYSVLVAEMVKQANFGFSGGYNPVSHSAKPNNYVAAIRDAKRAMED